MDQKREFDRSGFIVCKNAVSTTLINAFKSEILSVGKSLSGRDFDDVDEMYSYIKAHEPKNAGLLYDACKRMPSMHAIAYQPQMLETLRSVGCKAPAVADVNFRIDSQSREQYLFGWHQDYWFSMGSRNGLVAWMPLTDVTEDIGGLEIISDVFTDRKIYDVRGGGKFDSYADLIVLDETIPSEHATSARVEAGDILLFRFDVLHRSLPVLSTLKSRWTVQARYCDFEDAEFQLNGFRTASVSKTSIPYLEYLESQKRSKGQMT